MREIKFRAWHKKGKGYFYWNHFKEFFSGLRIAINEKLEFATPLSHRSLPDTLNMEGTVRTWYYDSKRTNIFSDSDFVIEQYTGLKDSKCVEIYEGDIVKYNYMPYGGKEEKQTYGSIVFLEGEFIVDYDNNDSKKGFVLNLGYNLLVFEDLEIVGNIHQNQELLK